VPLLSLESV